MLELVLRPQVGEVSNSKFIVHITDRIESVPDL